MPIIPSELQALPADVPSLPRESVGATTEVGSAVARLGSTVFGISDDMLTKFKDSEATDAASKAHYQSRFDSQDKLAMLKLQNPTGYMVDQDGNQVVNPDDGSYRTISQEFRDWANDRFVADQQSMPTALAQQKYQAFSRKDFEDSLLQAHADELQLRVGKFSQDLADNVRFASNRLENTPLASEAYKSLDQLSRDVLEQMHLIGAGQVHDNVNQVQNEMAAALFRGYIGQTADGQVAGGTNPETGAPYTLNQSIDKYLSVLRGEDYDSQNRKFRHLPTFSDTMDPKQKLQFEQSLINMRETAKSIGKNSWEKKVTDTNGALKNEPKYSINLSPLLREGMEHLKDGSLDPYTYARDVGGILANNLATPRMSSPDYLLGSPAIKAKIEQQISDQMHAQAKSVLAQTQDYLDKSPNPSDKAKEFGKDKGQWDQVGGEMIGAAVEKLHSAGQEADAKAKSDFVDFAQFSPKVKALTQNIDLSSLRALQQSARVLASRNEKILSIGSAYYGNSKNPGVTLLSKNERATIGGMLTDDNVNYTDIGKTLTKLYQADPRNFQTMMDQMIKGGDLSAEYRLALSASGKNPSLQNEVLRAIRKSSEIRELADPVLKDNSHTMTDVEAAVQKLGFDHFNALTSSMDSGAAIQQQTLLRKVVATEAVSQYAKSGGEKHGGISINDAAQNAIDSFLTQQHTVVSTGGGGSGGMGARGSRFDASYGSRTSFWMDPALPGPQKAAIVKNSTRLLQGGELEKKFGATIPTNMGPISPENYWNSIESTGKMVNSNDGRPGYMFQYRVNGQWQYVMSKEKDRNGKQLPLYVKPDQLTNDLYPPKTQKEKNSDWEGFLLNQGGAQKDKLLTRPQP